jgi:hypothetical protein
MALSSDIVVYIIDSLDSENVFEDIADVELIEEDNLLDEIDNYLSFSYFYLNSSFYVYYSNLSSSSSNCIFLRSSNSSY